MNNNLKHLIAVASVLMGVLLLLIVVLLWSAYRDQQIEANAIWYEQCILEQEGVSVERCRMNNDNQNCVCRM
jgi:hypothetical protein